MENTTLATELLIELKHSSRRWFIAFIIMVVLELLTIGTFIWYITIPAEEYAIEQESTDRSLNIINGGTLSGSIPENNIQTQSGAE